MIRQVIKINSDLCNGCEACVKACHEGAIGMKDGKAILLRDDYCDGLGDCLPACPTNAITFETREALEYDEDAVKKNMEEKAKMNNAPKLTGCPGSMQQSFAQKKETPKESTNTSVQSELTSWPLQIKLVNPQAQFFNKAHLLIAADCTAFAYGNFHKDFIKNKVTLIGCPKLDEVNYSEKIKTILDNNEIKSVTVVRMEVPCCSGLANATINALKDSNKMIPWSVTTISLQGEILED
ncbi:MAG: ATP-binding protein [Lachnospirales bacterium]